MLWLPLKEHLTFKRGKVFFLFTVSSEELSFFLEEKGTAAFVNDIFIFFLKSPCVAQETELLQAVLAFVSEDTTQADYNTQ